LLPAILQMHLKSYLTTVYVTSKLLKKQMHENLTPYSKHANITMFGAHTAQIWFTILLQLVVLHQAGMYSCNLLDLYYRGAQFKSQPKYPEISHWFPSIRQGERQDSSLFWPW